jgi:hypothetical protein
MQQQKAGRDQTAVVLALLCTATVALISTHGTQSLQQATGCGALVHACNLLLCMCGGAGKQRQQKAREIKQDQTQRGRCHNSEPRVQCEMPQGDSTNLVERCVLASMQKTRCC